MPTELPEGFKGTRKSKPVKIDPALDSEPSKELPTWAKVLSVVVAIVGSWTLVEAFLKILHLIF